VRRGRTPLVTGLGVAVPLLAVAALNTGNNALYLLVSLLVGAGVATRAVGRYALQHLDVTTRIAGDASAGSPAAVTLSVTNTSPWLPATGLLCSLVGLPGRVFVSVVPPRRTVTRVLTTAFRRRGRVGMPSVRVEAWVPLPVLAGTRVFPQSGEVVVLPRRVPAGAVRLAALGERHLEGDGGRGQRGLEVDHLREFRPGDDRRDIHWKQTARQGRLVVMERQQAPPPAGYVVLDRQLPRLEDAVWHERFEDLVAEAAAAVRAASRGGRAVGLVVGSWVAAPGRGSAHLRRLLEVLALVRPVGPGEDPLPPRLGGGQVYRLAGGR